MSTVLGIIFGVVALLAGYFYINDNAYRRYSRAEMALDSQETDLEAASNNKMLGGIGPRVEAIGRQSTPAQDSLVRQLNEQMGHSLDLYTIE